MRLLILGCGDAFGSGGRFHTCFHVSWAGPGFLIDCGASSLIAMRRFGVDPNGIDTVFLTHLHGDHFGGLPWLILDAQFVSRRTKPLVIAGPAGTGERLKAAMEALFPGSSTAQRAFAVDVVEIEAGRQDVLGGIAVTPFAVCHPSGAPSHGLRIEAGGKVLSYTGDTEWVEDLIPLGHEADLLIAEGYTVERPVRFHLSWAALAARMPEIRPKRLVLTHMSPEMIANDPAGRYVAAEDGMVLEI
ncbi:ribonuclease BN (tRNA processing enzyme) [Methylobacterium sp. BE186]|uniref:MBL fold metallo-hydrolase n=1 Tax=Methylobacterium sp. BE186 TaxID=2817715 RepID=UPI002863A39E|nr:MBL fold metallo-hydrolase [Methylobacterium sp. BE186]MDR7035524.1 ribonuclease BN (tRNA processing enzyme) [Methylobacterium sp. BE186]